MPSLASYDAVPGGKNHGGTEFNATMGTDDGDVADGEGALDTDGG